MKHQIKSKILPEAGIARGDDFEWINFVLVNLIFLIFGRRRQTYEAATKP